MTITDVRIRKVSKTSKLKAVASIVIDNAIAIHDIQIIEGEKGVFIVMPARKCNDEEFRDIVHPISKQAREVIQEAIMSKFKEDCIERLEKIRK